MFYALTNVYSSETDTGFVNTWEVKAFTTKALRDKFVDEGWDIATKPVSRDVARRYFESNGPDYYVWCYVAAPFVFENLEYRGIKK